MAWPAHSSSTISQNGFPNGITEPAQVVNDFTSGTLRVPGTWRAA